MGLSARVCTLGRQNQHKRATGKAPFQQVYGMEVVLPVQLELQVMKLLQDLVA